MNIVESAVKYVCFRNGIIRDRDGKLIGCKDLENGLLYVNGYVEGFRVEDDEEMFELIDSLEIC